MAVKLKSILYEIGPNTSWSLDSFWLFLCVLYHDLFSLSLSWRSENNWKILNATSRSLWLNCVLQLNLHLNSQVRIILCLVTLELWLPDMYSFVVFLLWQKANLTIFKRNCFFLVLCILITIIPAAVLNRHKNFYTNLHELFTSWSNWVNLWTITEYHMKLWLIWKKFTTAHNY